MSAGRSAENIEYAELQITSNFSFLRGASHPDEFALQAAALGHRAIGIADRNSLAGVVRAHLGAKQADIPLLVGARLDLEDGVSLLAYPEDRVAYGRLSRLITLGRRRAPKGECELSREDVFDHGRGMVLIVLPPSLNYQDAFERELAALREAFSGYVYLAASHSLHGDDDERLDILHAIATRADVPMVATNDVHMHSAARRPLLDVLTCIREKCTVDTAGIRIARNGERRLKTPAEMARLFERYPDALARTVEIAERCRFSLDELTYEYPDEITSDGRTPQEELERLTEIEAKQRFPGGVPEKVARQIDHELALIGELGYAPYFLTVHDLVRFARSRDILCQGRGSAANSAVCFCLGITSVDPSQTDLLFERFVSSERNEPPDIDVDFEHERREEVIQYIYDKYGRERAGMTAVVTTYRARSAVREVGKALGLSQDTVGALAGQVWGWSSEGIDEGRVREVGLDPEDRRLRLALHLTGELIGFPRHLSQHVGGFVISRGPLSETVPIENAAMEGRTVIEWNKDDLDALGMLKIDVLSLGMLTCVRKAFDLLKRHYALDLDLATVPADDPAVYDMLCEADSIGVFQVESRAQMAFLPRMKPRSFYDLVIEVAIVRPGPIQGDMVHPYLRRRNGEEDVAFPSEALRDVLGKTLGVPLFQEQAMKIAIVGAGFSPAEADALRRAMATFRHTGTIHTFRDKFIAGMIANGYEEDFAERCFHQIEGFGDYGFPESHAASFALLVYVSAWLKCHYPAVFAAALLNSQPMGFYAPAQIVRDAREHGITVLPADVNHSDWDNTLEPHETGLALRLGFRQIKGLREEDAEWLVAARGNGYRDVASIWLRAGLAPSVLKRLARADAFGSIDLKRRDALWSVGGLGEKPLPLFEGGEEQGEEPTVILPEMTIGAEVVEDYAMLRLTLKRHPLDLLRPRLDGLTRAEDLLTVEDGARVSVAGLVLCRQRPGSAKGVIFVTLEDETGTANIIVWPKSYERFRRQVLSARLMKVTGKLQREGIVLHVIADKVENLSHMLDDLAVEEEDTFDNALARADEVTKPNLRGPDGNLVPSRLSAPPTPRRHPREQAKVLFPSRDFH
ncbi:MAG: error-prone DNA polymerase [Rhodospirillaceae bacterium]|nr:error-prone DNA polymerase [Rhodospirillaceae bacterium]